MATAKTENPVYGPFEEQMESEKNEFAQFETYLCTLFNLQQEIVEEMGQF